jgi:broad specificity phosphatase PhoE
MMADLFLVRHGETVWHSENRYAGWSDVELSHHGREQARALARWAGAAKLDGLWCSELRRSQETALPCAEASGLELKVDSRLNEVGFGQGEGLTAQEMYQRFPREADAFQADPVGHPLPGGEDPRAATRRAVACVGEIAQEVGRGRVLILTHNTLIRLILCHLLGIPLAHYWDRFPSVRNCCLN